MLFGLFCSPASIIIIIFYANPLFYANPSLFLLFRLLNSPLLPPSPIPELGLTHHGTAWICYSSRLVLALLGSAIFLARPYAKDNLSPTQSKCHSFHPPTCNPQ